MLFKNGEELKVKVLEVNEQTIIYKRCDNYSGPSYSVGKEKIHSITYTNGFKEIIEPPVKKPIQIIQNEDKEYPSEVIWATLLPFVLGAIGLFVSINFALKAKKKILAHPDKYKGLALAKFMFAFDILTLVAVVGLFLMLTNTGAFEMGLIILMASFIGIIAAAIYYFIF